MGELLNKPYEISVWEDVLDTQNGISYYKENKIAIIGSNTMTGYNKVYEPVFTKNINGEKTLTFSLKYKYYDPYLGQEITNPFASLLINERKVKLYYDNEWYDFVIKEHSESSDGLIWTYTLTDAFVLELSKQGYNLEFDTELNNNQGTAIELAQKVLENTEWTVDTENSSVGRQMIEEPIYKATVTAGFSAINVDEYINAVSSGQEINPADYTVTIEANTDIYIFYSYISNKNGKFLQFILQDANENYVLDDKNNINATNYRITNEATINNNIITIPQNGQIQINEIETKYHAYRVAYNQKTTYDPVLQKTVEVYQLQDENKTAVYKYTDYEYSTSDVVVSYITNGENFDLLESGELQGWAVTTPNSVQDSFNTVEVATYPEISMTTNLASLQNAAEIEGFIEAKFNGTVTNNYKNSIFNTGITDNASILESISKGQEFLFRWRAGSSDTKHGTLSSAGASPFTLIVAKYNEVSVNYESGDYAGDYTLYDIDPSGIILTFSGEGQILNNIIDSGQLNTEETAYIVDSVVQEPSTKYIYKNKNDSSTEYIWDKQQKKYVERTENNFLNYYYLTTQAQQAVSNTILADPTVNIGIFLFLQSGNDSNKYYYIQDIQLTKFIKDDNNEPLIIGNVPTASSISTDYYYIKPADNSVAESIEKYTSLPAIEADLGKLVPCYNEESEKVLSISESKSNCFNILQTIAETFEVWLSLKIEHDANGALTLDENYQPIKKVSFLEYSNVDNFAGFKYGINLNSIERTIESTEIVTKLIVDSAQSDYTDEGVVSIQLANANPSGESYIYNFSYFLNQGLIPDREQFNTDITNFYNTIKAKNISLNEAIQLKNNLSNSLTTVNSKRTTFSELISTAKENINTAQLEFQKATGQSYSYYKDQNITLSEMYVLSTDTEADEGTQYYILENGNYIAVDVTVAADKNPQEMGYYVKLVNLLDNEVVVDLIATIYQNEVVINNYSGLLTNLNEQYKQLRLQLYGTETYNFSVRVVNDSTTNQSILKVYLNEYVTPFSFKVGENTYTATPNVKTFDIVLTGEEYITDFILPDGYVLTKANGEEILSIEISSNTIRNFIIKPNTIEEGVDTVIKQYQSEKQEIINNFQKKYGRFIQEGTWNSTDYIDSELYYLDALQVSNNSAEPKVSYSINVVEVSELEGLGNYTFNVGDKTYIEDKEFFGWNTTLDSPAREEVIVSEVEWHLDEPDNNSITVQNYKTQFEDLFQRLSATVQTVEYNEATYAKTSSFMDEYGNIKGNVLAASLNKLDGKKFTLTSDGSVFVEGDNIVIQNLTNPANRVILNSEGIRISSDGGLTWSTALSGRGINLGNVYTGSLDTDLITIGGTDNPSFRWDKYGISAYKTNKDGIYDLQTYVRYDQYGLYGVKNGGSFKATSLDDVEEAAHFAITWNGFFIKNSYLGGGKVQISSNNDFQVINSNQVEKIKIGALEWINDNNEVVTTPLLDRTPSLYGIRINDNDGNWVLKTGDTGNLELKGTIYANAGNIGGMSVDEDTLTMNHTIFESGVGIYSDLNTEDNEPLFIISDVDGSATFQQINALGGTLGELSVIDTITVGSNTSNGIIQSNNFETGISGWAIKSDGTAEFQNAIVRGEVNAGSGNFYGNVTVGKDENDNTKPYININGTAARISSSNYQDGAGLGWMINSEGDAFFNNITARGAIKTAVFEYAEIQAVGGVFIFRPSSTIRTAEISGNDLVITVEKPLLFQKGSWCKISNYITNGEEPNINDTLLNGGLTHVYQISDISVVDSKTEITLNGAKALIDVIGDTSKLVGGALVSFGYEPNTYNEITLLEGMSPAGLKLYELVDGEYVLTEDTVIDETKTYYREMYQNGANNYGIGINSSDNSVNLPARAISLFETIINENNNPRVSYNYRGILGTLPQLSTSEVSDSIYNQYMAGTQGIYTDNMYIGDNNQYIAFYKDNNGNKQLKIKANQVVYEVVDEQGQGTGQYKDVTEVTKGADGEDAINVIIDSSAGTVFLNKQISTTLTCTVIKGNGTDITNQVTKFTWSKKNADGTIDTSWNRALAGNTIVLTEADVTSKAIFTCEVEF